MRRHHFVLAIILALPFALAACSPYTTISGPAQSCRVNNANDLPTTLHPGDHLSVSWKLDSPNNSPGQIKMTVLLYGPYDSIDAANADAAKAGPRTTPKLAAPTLIAMCNGQTYATTLQIPTNQQPGIYTLVQQGDLQNVVGSTTSSGSSSSTGAIITIAPPASS